MMNHAMDQYFPVMATGLNDNMMQLTSGPVLLANTLAWAVENNTSFPDAVLSLTKTGRPLPILSDTAGKNRISLNMEIFPPLLSKLNWDQTLHGLYKDLTLGIPLYKALQRRMKYFLPEYYLQAIEAAEKGNNLAVVLPAFAKRLNYTSNIKTAYRRSLALPLFELAAITLVISFLLLFIFPNMAKIFYELTPFSPMTMIHYLALCGEFFSRNFFIILCSVAGLILLWPFYRIPLLYVMEKIFIIVPGFRRELHELARLEMLACLASYLDAGEDMLDAAKFSRASSRSYWIRCKLKHFIIDLKQGKNWLASWDRLQLGKPLDNLLLHTTSATDQLLDGFETILQWSSEQVYRQSKRNRRRIGVAVTLFNAIIVAIIAISVFSMLIAVINSQAKTTGYETLRELEEIERKIP
jgi:type IV pilus assembly protein PilC